MFARNPKPTVASSAAPSPKPASKAPAPGALYAAFALRSDSPATPDRPVRNDYFGQRFPPSSAPIQRKAHGEVGSPADPLEHEADRVADAVMRGARATIRGATGEAPVRRACAACSAGQGTCPKCEEEAVRRKPVSGSPLPGGDVGAHVDSALAGGGQPLPAATRTFMEQRFEHDFSGVRVHADRAAVDAATALQARAFTTGTNVVFNANEYAPTTTEGRRLLAHELTHVVQQGGAAARTPDDTANRIAPREVVRAAPVAMIQRAPKASACATTYTKTSTFAGLIKLVRAAEARMSSAGITSIDDQVKTLRGIYYGTTWSEDYKVEKSATRNTGFQLFTGTTSSMKDPHAILDCGLFDALQASQDVSDGKRSVDFGHLIIALDARESFVGRNLTLPLFGGTGLQIVTWLGDLGGGAGNLALHRVSAPSTRASVSFSGTDYGASSNLEGDVAGYVAARGGSTSVGSPSIASGKGIGDALEDYLSPGKPGTEWKDRATTFLQMNGAKFDGAGNLTNGSALEASFAGQIETFACQYLASRLKDGKITSAAFNSATDHVKPASEEVASVFVDALDDCHKTGSKLEGKKFPKPKPAAPGACSTVKGAIGAGKQGKGVFEEIEKRGKDLWHKWL
jgi:hypothetical protein